MITHLILPLIVAIVLIIAIIKKVDIISAFAKGAGEGLKTIRNILPILLFVLSIIQIMRLSGFLDFFVTLIAPAAEMVGIPSEILPTVLLKPFSGSGSLAMLEDTITNYGVDSRIGRLAAVITASTETTFYTISVYLGNMAKKSGKIIACALLTDVATVIFACMLIV